MAVGLIGDPDGLDILADLSEDPYQIGEAFQVRAGKALNALRDKIAPMMTPSMTKTLMALRHQRPIYFSTHKGIENSQLIDSINSA